MNSQFQNCPKCATRNFLDDKICGICKTQLTQSKSIPNQQHNVFVRSKYNYLIALLILVGLAFFYYTSKKDVVVNTKYTLVETSINNQRGFNACVRINEKISDKELKSIAQKVKEDINAISEKGVVFFLLPEMEINNGAWAAVDFTPDMEIRVIGQSISEETAIKNGLEKITDYVGLWSDNGTHGDVIIRIRKDKKLCYVFEYISPINPKPSDMATPLIKKIKNGKTIYKDTEHPEQFYLLEDNGDLSVYDNYGFVATFKTLK